MSDQFTEVTTEGYGQRLGGSLVAALFGLILLPVAIGLLYWNEGRAVTAMRALSQGASSIVEANAAAPDPAANGKLVHVTGTMQAATAARDPEFGVTAPGLLRLSRTAEMYQWKQDSSSRTEQSIGGTKTTETTYTYQRVWSSQALNSSAYKEPENHRNPPMNVRSAVFDGGQVTLGAYRVDPSVLARVSNYSALQPQTAPPPDYRLSGDAFYRGQDPDQPAIGDVRVRFTAIPAQTVSVAAAQSDGTLTEFRAANGYTVVLAAPGVVSAAALFQDARQAAGTLTWILRGVGFVVLLVGLLCLASPLTTLFAVLPFLESFVGAGAFLVALTLAVPITLITIGVAWIAHRPLVGGGLLAGALVTLLLLRALHPRRRAA
jgi:hypothetical protein